MDIIISAISRILSVILKLCYSVTNNFGLSIIIFTLLTKFILLPVSILIQKNSIKMIQMQPKIDALKIKYIDDKDTFIDKQLELYKENHYHSSLNIIPLVLQLILVLGLLDLVYKPLTYLLELSPEIIDSLNTWLETSLNITSAGKSAQIEIIHQLQLGSIFSGNISPDTLKSIKSFPMNFAGLNLGSTPSLSEVNILLIIPALSGLSAWIMCEVQNRINVLQLTAGKLNKYGTTIFMVIFSVYFSFLVPAGVGLYWIFGNIFAIPSMILVNLIIPPKKFLDVDYIKKVQAQKKEKEEKYRKYHKKEKEDYKKFSSEKNMKLMIYSESNGFYKYYSGMIDYICSNSDINIHYVTSDPEDKIFLDNRKQIHAYYVSQDKYLIPLFLKLDCDMCMMTMPDLEKYHIKRSKVRKDIEYVYVPHGMGSNALTLRKGALDWYDTVFCVGPDAEKEIRETEELYKTKTKLLVQTGYPLLDEMINEYDKSEHKVNQKTKILIAPSWQPDNIIDLCINQLLDKLSATDYDIIVRPHPQMVRHSPEIFEILKNRYQGANIDIQTDFSKNSPVMEADILITDWSDISFEFAFTTKKPVIFINTPMKIMNPEYNKIATEPINIALRNIIGISIDINDITSICQIINDTLKRIDEYHYTIEDALKANIYNIGNSKKIYGRYVIKSISSKLSN